MKKECFKAAKMGADLVRVELSSLDEIKNNPLVWNIICEGGLKNFINTYKGHDDNISLEVARSWENGRYKVNRMEVVFSLDSIA